MSLFDEQNTEKPADPQDTAPAPAPPASDQLLAGIKNEQGEQKYANVEEALKALQHSQEFIATLKEENSSMTAQSKSQEQLQELVNSRPQIEEPPAPVAPVGLSEEDVLAVVEKREQKAIANKNVQTVKEAFNKQFGAESGKALQEAVANAGLTQELADTLAQRSPNALLKLLNIDNSSPVKVNAGSVDTSQLNGKPAPPKKFDPFSKKEDKNLTAWQESVKHTNERLGITS